MEYELGKFLEKKYVETKFVSKFYLHEEVNYHLNSCDTQKQPCLLDFKDIVKTLCSRIISVDCNDYLFKTLFFCFLIIYFIIKV